MGFLGIENKKATKTAKAWILYLAFPLDKLYFNLTCEGGLGRESLAWSPTFSDSFHAPERFGELTLE